jgi:hypothetical protein
MADDDFGYYVENVLQQAEKRKRRKKKNSGDKGDRGERLLVQLLNKHFATNVFSRTSGSGNRWSQVEFVKKDYIGDIVCPDAFRFVVECKFGYTEEIDLYSALASGHYKLDEWVEKADNDSERSDRLPIICWKREYLPWLGFVKTDILDQEFDYQFKYREWTGTALSNLLGLGKGFFYVESLLETSP